MDLIIIIIKRLSIRMDEPKTHRQTKKNQKEKAKGKSIYTAKHVRMMQTLAEKKAK
jgi:hypothetical protein